MKARSKEPRSKLRGIWKGILKLKEKPKQASRNSTQESKEPRSKLRGISGRQTETEGKSKQASRNSTQEIKTFTDLVAAPVRAWSTALRRRLRDRSLHCRGEEATYLVASWEEL